MYQTLVQRGLSAGCHLIIPLARSNMNNNTFIQRLLGATYCAKRFAYIFLLNSRNDAMRRILLYLPVMAEKTGSPKINNK